MPTGGGAFGGCAARVQHAGLAEHDTRMAHGVGKHVVIAGQRAQLSPSLVVKIAKRVSRYRWRRAVGLGEKHVETDRQRPHFGQARHEIGDQRARPRPLAEAFEAFLVDVDDHHRMLGHLARPQHLVIVEHANAQFLNQRRIRDAQRGKRNQQRKRQAARKTEASRQAREPSHGKLPPAGRSDACVIFPGTPA